MVDINYLIGGSALVVITLIASFWSRTRVFLTQLLSFVIVPVEVHSIGLAAATQYYLNTNFTRSPFGIRAFSVMNIFVRRDRKRRFVLFERIGSGGTTFWKGFFPIWVTFTDVNPEDNSDLPNRRPSNEAILTLRFLRFTFKVSEIVRNATNVLNDLDENSDRQHRFFIRVFRGSRNMNDTSSFSHYETSSTYDETNDVFYRQNKPVDMHWDDLGPEVFENNLESMVLDEKQRDVIEEIKFWLDSADWYKDKAIPWRRGFLFYGPPGCGKTSFIRSIGEKFGIPIFLFNLASLDNNQFLDAWHAAIIQTRWRIMLIEDIDGVFDKRVNVAKTDYFQGLTYDCFLNAIDGVDRQDGTLLFVTTNDVSKLDPALASVTDSLTGDRISTRPGRIDRVVKFDHIDVNGLKQIMERVSGDELTPSEKSELLAEGMRLNYSPAQFQEACIQAALNNRFRLRQEVKT